MAGHPTAQNRVAELLADQTPCVAVPFTDDADDADLARAQALGADIAEFRIDRFTSREPDHVVSRVRCSARLPTIATIRNAAEGGAWTGTGESRLELFRAVLPDVEAVDVELSADRVMEPVLTAAHALDRPVIVSMHDFRGTPPLAELTDSVARARDAGADVVKVATMVRSQDDLRSLAGLLSTDHGIALVVIGMGSLGAPSRLLFPFLGSRLTFAAFGESSAPGQLPLHEMAATLRSLSPAYALRHPAP